MRGRWAALAQLRRGEAGLTLIELMLAAAIGLIVVGGAMTVFLGAVRSEPRTAKQVDAIQKARVTAERITRELRQGVELPTTPSASQLAVITYVKSASCGGAAGTTAIACRVTYTCASGSCTRVESQPNGSAPGAATTVAEGLASNKVFSYVPDASDPGYVGVTFEVAAGDGGTVTLGDGVALRNLDEEEGG